MVITLMLLFCDRWTGNAVHETAGVTLASLTLWHAILNVRWFTGIIRGRYSPVRLLRLALNACLLVLFAATVITGAMLSRTIFDAFEPTQSLSVRTLHMALAHWTLLVAGLHCGIYWPRLAARFSWVIPQLMTRLWRCLPVALALLGMFALYARDMAYVLSMQSAFSIWIDGDTPWRMCTEYAAMFCLACVSGRYLSRIFIDTPHA